MDSRLRGNDGEFCGNDGEFCGNDGEFCGNDGEFFGNDGECFAGMVGTHDCVVIDLSLSFPRRRESIKAHQS